ILEVRRASDGNGVDPFSRENYTLALDKGWHVGASTGQDTHDNQWITANKERAFIIAPRKTKWDIYEAIRNRRIYASTDDDNIQLVYKINGEWMGSILDNPSVLHFTVDVYDPNPGDTIANIKIYADGN